MEFYNLPNVGGVLAGGVLAGVLARLKISECATKHLILSIHKLQRQFGHKTY